MENTKLHSWEPAGPSGGGQTVAVCVSPHDPDLILVGSDMGSAYRSTDGGNTFTMYPGSVLSRLCCDFDMTSFAFHPTKKHTVYAGAWNGLFLSCDDGATFEKTENFGMGFGPARIVFSADGEQGLLLYNDWAAEQVTVKDLTGKTLWQAQPRAIGGAIWEKNILIALKNGVYFCTENGEFVPVLSEELNGFAWDREDTAYVTVEKRLYAIDLRSGNVTLRYTHSFGTLRQIAALGKTLYVGLEGSELHYDGSDHSTILKSSDGGSTFAPMLFQHPDHPCCNLEKSWIGGKWGWYLSPSSMAVTPADPALLVYTNFMGIGITRDGGKTFREIGASTAPDHIQVMTSWNYVIDPHDENVHYIPMTDFSGWRSGDGGNTWEHAWNGNPWKSNIYAVAPHPTVPGRVLGAAGAVHDLPYWHWLRRQTDSWGGGIIQSDDYGKTWKPQDRSGMGPFGLTTDILYFKGTSFAAVLGQGLYRAQCGEEYWKLLDETVTHKNVAKLFTDGGALFAVAWPQKTQDGIVPGALYRSEDGDRFSQVLLPPECKYPVTMLPVTDKHWLVSCFDSFDYYVKNRMPYDHDENALGVPGLYETTDAGRSWRRIYDGPLYSCSYIDGKLAVCTREEGLQYQTESGWERDTALPIFNPHTVTVAPDGMCYVTSFGQGVYKKRCF